MDVLREQSCPHRRSWVYLTTWTNAWIESFNGRLRDELLNAWRFDSLLEAKVLIEDWSDAASRHVQ